MGIRVMVGLMLVIAAPLLMINVVAEEGTGVTHVGGQVLCQDCTKGFNEWIHGSKPVQGAKVSVICFDERKNVLYYESDETDIAGKFNLTINKIVNGKKLKPISCVARLVSSPDPVCNIATDLGGGRKGVKLARPDLLHRDLFKHVVGPFYYTTPMCDEPDA